ncbi:MULTISPECIES: fluoride efflux transporter FluC [unclassified Streptomyces]|uniref:fluoride efflux transporter FluC n=1 Tax=unclassified Streptomyces TaxID=2593676 RepID=UPI002553B91E|nr:MULTISPECIES: CrcB family protein [unclassified Streptomyces]WRZ68981.1 CrcB family protein [Streptomyces sp. NBC_01257]
MDRKMPLHRRTHPDHHPGVQLSVVGAVAVGGAAGAVARYGAERLWPNGTSAFPWTILLVNTVGCFLMGVLMVTLKLRFPGAPRLVSPLLGTGVLGGFTSFSHYTDNVRELFGNHRPGYAVGCLLLTVVAALAAVTAGAFATHVAFGRSRGTASDAS